MSVLESHPSSPSWSQRARKPARAMAWILAATVVFVTLGPQGLRPHLADAQVERFGAYFVTAATFVVGYPRRPRLIALFAVCAAILLEIGQAFAPGRDPGVPDAIAKALGGLCGAAASMVLLRFRPRAVGP